MAAIRILILTVVALSVAAAEIPDSGLTSDSRKLQQYNVTSVLTSLVSTTTPTPAPGPAMMAPSLAALPATGRKLQQFTNLGSIISTITGASLTAPAPGPSPVLAPTITPSIAAGLRAIGRKMLAPVPAPVPAPSM